jgi:HD superfamily phosphohydrolase YqeK
VRIDGLLEAAARGELPAWARVSASRRAHMERVAALLGGWAAELGHDAAGQTRWRAAGLLHDGLREASPDELRPLVPAALRDAAAKLLHGPAAAERLRTDGVADEPLLRAVAFHTIGHPELDTLGRCLFIADYIEPGRRYDPALLALLRARMPHHADDVLVQVLRARIERLLRERRPLRPETAAFWNTVVAQDAARLAH